MKEVIRLNEVSYGYEKGHPVVEELSFSVNEGEAVGVIGANGAGKSTLFKLMLGILFGKGEVQIDGIKVSQKTLPEVRKSMGYVLQNSDNQMFMPTVYEDMMFGLLNYGMEKEEADKKVAETLELLGITELRDRYNHKISGGEKRMAAIATVLAMEPKVLLMDEPTTALDPYNRRQVINTIKSLGTTKIIASHDLDMIWDTCDRVILLSSGRIVADGRCEEILKNKNLLEANRLELPLRLA